MVPKGYIDTLRMYDEYDGYKNTHTLEEFQAYVYAVAKHYACRTGWFMVEGRRYKAIYIKPIKFDSL